MSSVRSGFGDAKNDFRSFDFRMPYPPQDTKRDLLPSNPLTAPLGQTLAQGHSTRSTQSPNAIYS